MKQIIIGVMVFALGFLLLIFATMFGLVVAVGMLIASPFIKRKLQKIKDIHQNQAEKHSPLASKTQSSCQIIDGDFQDITDKR